MKIIVFLKKLLRKRNNIFFVGKTDVLPPPLGKDEEEKIKILREESLKLDEMQ